MTRVIRLAVGLLAAVALIGVAPQAASATYGVCGSGEFCVFQNADTTGGMYHFSGSDNNLNNDRFEGEATWLTVGNRTRSAWNHGNWQSNGVNHVLVYTGPNRTGTVGCVLFNTYGSFVYPFAGNVESYRWVNRATCDSVKRRAITL